MILTKELEEDIYMDQLNEFIQKSKENLKCKLKKLLYGLKQSTKALYQWIDNFFVKECFIKS